MAALHSALAASERVQLERSADSSAILELVSAALWRWLRVHWGDVVIRKKILFFTATLHVRDLAPFLAQLIGPEPVAQPQP
jgi:hypothetical protein